MSRQSDSLSTSYASNLIRHTSVLMHTAKKSPLEPSLPTVVIPAKAGISVYFFDAHQTDILTFATMTPVRT